MIPILVPSDGRLSQSVVFHNTKLEIHYYYYYYYQSAEFRRRRYSKTSVRGEIRPKIGNFRYSSDICVVLPDLRNIRQIFMVCLTSRNIRQIFDSGAADFVTGYFTTGNSITPYSVTGNSITGKFHHPANFPTLPILPPHLFGSRVAIA